MYSQADGLLFEAHWHRSKVLVAVFIILLAVVLSVIAFLPLSIYWQMTLVMVLLVYSGSIFLKDVLLRLSSSFTAIRKTSSNNWFIYNKEKEWQIIRLCPDQCVVLPWAIVLVFFVGKKRHQSTICLLRHSFVLDDFRQLVIYLRYGLRR